MATIPTTFKSKKQAILDALSQPEENYTDLSPKGTVDEGIRDLIDLVNAVDGLVTTSSCAGRVTVFHEGEKLARHPIKEEEPALSRPAGGKGGGKWLYVSHLPVQSEDMDFMREFGLREGFTLRQSDEPQLPDIDPSTRFIRFQFEPMILHVVAASLEHAQLLLSAAINAGMRESGIQSTKYGKGTSKNQFPVVGVRSTGLALSSVIGIVYGPNDSEYRSLVTNDYLKIMVMIANLRFDANTKRTARFKQCLESTLSGKDTPWEDSAARAQRKRAEGLGRQRDLHAAAPTNLNAYQRSHQCHDGEDETMSISGLFSS